MGPLMAPEQLREMGERVTDILFTKYILSAYAEAYGTQAEKGESMLTRPVSISLS